MISVIAKINAKDEKSLRDIKAGVKTMISHIPVMIGDYWFYGVVPLEFEEVRE